MSDEKKALFLKATDEILKIPGAHLHHLQRFINGNVSISKKGIIKFPMQLDINILETTVDDIRAIFAPHIYEGKMIPVICFIDPEEYEKGRATMPVEEARK
jgi:hypothetical protein